MTCNESKEIEVYKRQLNNFLQEKLGKNVIGVSKKFKCMTCLKTINSNSPQAFLQHCEALKSTGAPRQQLGHKELIKLIKEQYMDQAVKGLNDDFSHLKKTQLSMDFNSGYNMPKGNKLQQVEADSEGYVVMPPYVLIQNIPYEEALVGNSQLKQSLRDLSHGNHRAMDFFWYKQNGKRDIRKELVHDNQFTMAYVQFDKSEEGYHTALQLDRELAARQRGRKDWDIYKQQHAKQDYHDVALYAYQATPEDIMRLQRHFDENSLEYKFILKQYIKEERLKLKEDNRLQEEKKQKNAQELIKSQMQNQHFQDQKEKFLITEQQNQFLDAERKLHQTQIDQMRAEHQKKVKESQEQIERQHATHKQVMRDLEKKLTETIEQQDKELEEQKELNDILLERKMKMEENHCKTLDNWAQYFGQQYTQELQRVYETQLQKFQKQYNDQVQALVQEHQSKELERQKVLKEYQEQFQKAKQERAQKEIEFRETNKYELSQRQYNTKIQVQEAAKKMQLLQIDKLKSQQQNYNQASIKDENKQDSLRSILEEIGIVIDDATVHECLLCNEEFAKPNEQLQMKQESDDLVDQNRLQDRMRIILKPCHHAKTCKGCYDKYIVGGAKMVRDRKILLCPICNTLINEFSYFQNIFI